MSLLATSTSLSSNEKQSIVWARQRESVLKAYKGQMEGITLCKKAIISILHDVVNEMGARYQPAKIKNGHKFDAFVEFSDGSKAKFLGNIDG